MTDMVIGLDFHTVLMPVPVPLVPHRTLAASFVDDAAVRNNKTLSLTECRLALRAVWVIRYTFPWERPPSMLNMAYWRRYLLNIPKQLMLIALTLLANLAISRISAIFVKPQSAGGICKDVTGVGTSVGALPGNRQE